MQKRQKGKGWVKVPLHILNFGLSDNWNRSVKIDWIIRFVCNDDFNEHIDVAAVAAAIVVIFKP